MIRANARHVLIIFCLKNDLGLHNIHRKKHSIVDSLVLNKWKDSLNETHLCLHTRLIISPYRTQLHRKSSLDTKKNISKNKLMTEYLPAQLAQLYTKTVSFIRSDGAKFICHCFHSLSSFTSSEFFFHSISFVNPPTYPASRMGFFVLFVAVSVCCLLLSWLHCF